MQLPFDFTTTRKASGKKPSTIGPPLTPSLPSETLIEQYCGEVYKSKDGKPVKCFVTLEETHTVLNEGDVVKQNRTYDAYAIEVVWRCVKRETGNPASNCREEERIWSMGSDR